MSVTLAHPFRIDAAGRAVSPCVLLATGAPVKGEDTP